MNEEKNKWQSMEFAPKDGTRILVWDGEEINLVEWRSWHYHYPGWKDQWAWCLPGSDQDEQGGCETVDNPICWQQLPKSP